MNSHPFNTLQGIKGRDRVGMVSNTCQALNPSPSQLPGFIWGGDGVGSMNIRVIELRGTYPPILTFPLRGEGMEKPAVMGGALYLGAFEAVISSLWLCRGLFN